jgi:hypothetical protein
MVTCGGIKATTRKLMTYVHCYESDNVFIHIPNQVMAFIALTRFR